MMQETLDYYTFIVTGKQCLVQTAVSCVTGELVSQSCYCLKRKVGPALGALSQTLMRDPVRSGQQRQSDDKWAYECSRSVW